MFERWLEVVFFASFRTCGLPRLLCCVYSPLGRVKRGSGSRQADRYSESRTLYFQPKWFLYVNAELINLFLRAASFLSIHRYSLTRNFPFLDLLDESPPLSARSAGYCKFADVWQNLPSATLPVASEPRQQYDVFIHCARMLSRRQASNAVRAFSRTPGSTRAYAVSLKESVFGNNRVFKDTKAYQYNWYTRILETSNTSPLIILHHNEFTAERLKKLRTDIVVAAQRVKPSLSSPTPVPSDSTTPALPTLTVVRSSIFGVALRRFGDIPVKDLENMIHEQSGGFAVLSIPSMHPPLINAVLRAMDRSVPPKPPKTPEQIKAEEAAKTADPEQPGRRMKRVRQVRTPELKVMGAIIEGRVFLPPSLNEVSKMPTLETLRAQIVGLLSAPSSQLAAVLSQASGGQLARTLEGLKKSLEEEAGEKPDEAS